MKGKENEIEELKKNLNEKETEIKKVLKENEHQNNKKNNEKDIAINELKKKLEERE